MKYDFLIVGAGFAGAVCAQRLAASGASVLVLEKRNHIGGNAYDQLDAAGVLVHPYGPHIFHTNSKRVFEYLSKFTDWRFYEHRVLARVEGEFYPIPINRTTINRLYGLDLDNEGVSDFLQRARLPRDSIKTSEDVVLNSVGRDLCEKFFRGYTKKQWGLDLSQLSAGVAARIPTRINDDDRYFSDEYQFMPAAGYTAMFKKLLHSDKIKVVLSSDFEKKNSQSLANHIIYTGPIDAFFEYCFGKLPYRSLRFEHEHIGRERFQEAGTVNFPNDECFTRITEFKYLTGQTHPGTSIVREYPCEIGEPYYPIPRPENEIIYRKYSELSENTSDVSFVGRLASYRYYNMDQVVASALSLADKLIG